MTTDDGSSHGQAPDDQTPDGQASDGQTPDERALTHGLDQLAALLDAVGPDVRDDPTPCERWTVADLVDHVLTSSAGMARMLRGESVDWSAPAPAAGGDPAGAFRAQAHDVLDAARGQEGTDWVCAELAVHTWDLATALGRPTGDLDPEVADRGLAFMRANLTPETRGEAFGPERPAPDGANAYQRVAAFAGREA
ncbi:maleylpyruvate isomerase family mycothiol-dependent enzyme [Cellulomonas sp. PhB143]|uniref:maleylpyruvate isomerase family mycothiol-dependent enzyme n=1 Tax=Cellulomonas sp. PhB143 TaxID=2485186 RepID=UPI000F49D3F9|nr:maleylpyruvate isomerase family mycothiol-dependent enzyme [Cellulomonas sp. PhB143]ROS76700.1 uncharacterized protein (TIGR03083 family) [Cellulomonas sp. PhB143]